MSDDTFPPFIPAKPKTTMDPLKLAQAQPPPMDPLKLAPAQPLTTEEIIGVVESTFKPPRKRKAAEPKPNGSEKRKRRKPRPTSIPLDAVTSFAGLKPDEAEQVVMFCEALQTHSKAARKRIAEAIGKIFA